MKKGERNSVPDPHPLDTQKLVFSQQSDMTSFNQNCQISTDGRDVPKETKPAKTMGQKQLGGWGWGGVIFSLFFDHLLCHRSVSLIVAERGRSWAVIGPSWLRPLLTSDPTSEEEVGTEGQMPFKPDELGDVTAAER